MQSYLVALEVTSTHVFHIDANTPEEAISVAEQGLESGEDIGEITESEIIGADAIPEVVQ